MSAQFNSGIYVAVEAVVVFALAIFFGIKELRNLRRFDRERAARNKAAAQGQPAGEESNPTGAAS